MRDIVYVVAGFGIIGVAVGGFFGNLNWKWLSAIIIGLVVLAVTGAFVKYVTGEEVQNITDTLKSLFFLLEAAMLKLHSLLK